MWMECDNEAGEHGFFPSPFGQLARGRDDVMPRLLARPRAEVQRTFLAEYRSQLSVEVSAPALDYSITAGSVVSLPRLFHFFNHS